MGSYEPRIEARYEAGRPSPYHMPPPQSQPADWETSISGLTLRNWARQLSDNSSIASAVITSRITNGVCAGLVYEPMVKDKSGKLIPELNDAIRRKHELWSRSVDVTGEYTRQELERLVWMGWDVDGEAFVRKVMLPRQGSELDYRLQLLEPDIFPLSGTGMFSGANVTQSVQKDQWGMPIAYLPYPYADYRYYTGQFVFPEDTTPIPARDMFHLKRTKRANQTRGVTLFAQSIFRIADIGEFQQSHRLAARGSADQYMSINRAVDMDAPEVDPDTGEPTRNWVLDRMSVIDGLAPGESANFNTPQHPNQNAVDFVREDVRFIAACCRVGFSQIMQVFDSSYAAQRLEVVDTFRKTDSDRQKFVSDFALAALYEFPVQDMIRKGLLPSRALRRADRDTLLDVRIDGPQMPIIDPVKDRQAYEIDRDRDWDSRLGVVRKLGRVPSQVDAEIEQDKNAPENKVQPTPAAPIQPPEEAEKETDE